MSRLFKYLWGIVKSFFNFIFCCCPKNSDDDSSLGIRNILPDRSSDTSSGERSSADSSEKILEARYNLDRTPSPNKRVKLENYGSTGLRFLGDKDPKVKEKSNSNGACSEGKPRSLSL